MTWTYDLSTEIGRVRLMVPDRDEAEPIFTDEEIGGFLAIEGDVKLATAQALETIASDEVYTLKAIKAGTVSLDGPGTSKAILGRATLLRDQVAYGNAALGQYFDVAEEITGPFGYRERVLDERLRQG